MRPDAMTVPITQSKTLLFGERFPPIRMPPQTKPIIAKNTNARERDPDGAARDFTSAALSDAEVMVSVVVAFPLESNLTGLEFREQLGEPACIG
jgi:hypothetical protein